MNPACGTIAKNSWNLLLCAGSFIAVSEAIRLFETGQGKREDCAFDFLVPIVAEAANRTVEGLKRAKT